MLGHCSRLYLYSAAAITSAYLGRGTRLISESARVACNQAAAMKRAGAQVTPGAAATGFSIYVSDAGAGRSLDLGLDTGFHATIRFGGQLAERDNKPQWRL